MDFLQRVPAVNGSSAQAWPLGLVAGPDSLHLTSDRGAIRLRWEHLEVPRRFATLSPRLEALDEASSTPTRRTWWPAGAGAIALMLGCPSSPDGPPPPVEDCSAPGDEDADGRPDCADPECWGPSCPEDCRDTWDNDGDGRRDCDDLDCPCVEECANGVDDDGDGRIDCEDRDCAVPACPELCDNVLDDDGDGAIDALDPDCPALPPVETCAPGEDADADGLSGCDDPDCVRRGRERMCVDGLDDDCDGLVDCADPDCPDWQRERGPSSYNVTLCTDGLDNDCDGLTDTADADCADLPDCYGGGDSDGDGLVGCADPDCAGACAENCWDGADNDGDGLLDCEDGDCAERPPCVEICDNHRDDDDDGATDCWDDECWGPACVGATASEVRAGTLLVGDSIYFGDDWVGHAHAGRAVDVSGVARVADGYGGTAESCAWTVGLATFVGGELTRRADLVVDPACADARLLPFRLFPYGTRVHRASVHGHTAYTSFIAYDLGFVGSWYAADASTIVREDSHGPPVVTVRAFGPALLPTAPYYASPP